MKLSKYILLLQEIAERYGDLDVVYSKDDEGNDFNTVNYEPSVGRYDKYEREFYPYQEEGDEFSISDIKDCNAVCVN